MGTVSIFDEEALNVVVDNSNFVLEFLTLKAKSRHVYNGGKIKCYNNADTFLKDLQGFPASTNFFFGVFYGVGTKLNGADLAQAVKNRNRSAPVFVVTTEMDVRSIVEAKRNGIVDAIFPKELYYTEPHDNAQLTPEENEKFFSVLRIVSPDSKFRRTYAFLEERDQCLDEISRARKKKTEMASETKEIPKTIVAEISSPIMPKSNRLSGILGMLTRLKHQSSWYRRLNRSHETVVQRADHQQVEEAQA